MLQQMNRTALGRVGAGLSYMLDDAYIQIVPLFMVGGSCHGVLLLCFFLFPFKNDSLLALTSYPFLVIYFLFYNFIVHFCPALLKVS